MRREDGDGWHPWGIVSWVAGGAVSVPLVVGFVTMGAAVLAARTVRDAAREAWGWLAVRRQAPSERIEPDDEAS
jgi:hypothetical protein